jgi:hypothetical protein
MMTIMERYVIKKQEYVLLLHKEVMTLFIIMFFNHLALTSSSKIPKWLFSVSEQTTK